MAKVKKVKETKQQVNGRETAELEQLQLVNVHSAAIDVGSMLMVVSYTDRHGKVHIKEYDSFTDSLHKMAQTLQEEKVKKVCMEATGSYWMVLYRILESYGIEVILVNPSHYKNVEAQKTDKNDARWLHRLLAHGLVRSSHVATELYRELRGYLQARDIYKDQKSATLNRIQKVLTTMNIKVQHLISDIEGVSGMILLRAIADGIHDPHQMLSLIDTSRLKASEEELLHSLKGDYRMHDINILANDLKMYDFLKIQMKSYDKLIENVLQKMLPENEQGEKPVITSKTTKVRKNQYGFNLRSYLTFITGVDVAEVEGLDEISLLTILSVTGKNMKKWPTAGHFTSWLNLSPRPRISGGKIIGYEKRFTNNVATQAFRMAAQTLWQSKGPLGQQYRSMAGRKGSKKAIKALARKLAVIFYNMVLKQEPYDIKKVTTDKEKQMQRKITRLQKEAKQLGLIVTKAA